MIRILHTADLHLDKELLSEDPAFSQLRQKEQRALFANIMMYTRDQKVDVLIFAGDLLDRALPTEETQRLLLREFENTPETEIFLVPGKNDCYRRGCFYDVAEFSPNVHVFKSEQITSFEVDQFNVTVYGYAFCHRKLYRNPFAVMPPMKKERCNLLCGYGSLEGEEGCCPVTAEEIAHSGVDYLALGHEHRPSELLKAGDTFYAVSGSPEGLDYGESGHRGARILALDKQNGELLLQSKTVRFSRRRFERVSLSAEGLGDCFPLFEQLSGRIRELGADADTFLEVEITGQVLPSFRLKREVFAKLSERLGRLTFRDHTLMVCEPSGDGKDFRSVFVNTVARSTPDRELRSKILKCGFEALERSEKPEKGDRTSG